MLTGRESHGLPSALLLGDKTALSDSTRRDFSRAGASHMLAISGLHVALLFGLLEGFLRLLYVPKRARIAVMGLGAVAYLILLGFPPSATRAVIMLGMTCLAYYSNGRADSLTSLGLAGCLILAVTPQAVADAGFWMSFLATMGLITLTPLLRTGLARLDHRDASAVSRRLRRYGTKLLTALAVGIVAVSFVLLVVTAVIGEMSILSPISTLLLTPFCGVIPVLSLLALPLTGTSVGVLLGNTVGGISSLMADLAARLAQPSWTVISLRHPAVLPIAVGMTAATLVLLVIRLPVRRRAAVVLPILVGWISLGGVLTAHAYLTRHEIRTTYLQPSAVSEALVLVSGNRGVVCDLSNGSLSAMTAAAREAELQGATELAACVLTHYHSRTSGALATFLERETVRALWMPTPTDPETYYRMLACLEQAEAAGVEVRLYDKGQALTLFGESRLILETSELARSVQPVLLISLDVPHKDGSPGTEGDHRLVYCGSAVFESDLSSRAAEWVGEADTVILGGHGPLCKAPFGREADFTRAREIILSAFGETADYFAPAELSPDTTLWLGQKRMVLP